MPRSTCTPVPATQVIARDRHAEYLVRLRFDRGDVRAGGGRAPAPPAHRGGGGAGGIQARTEGLVGDAPQAQPDLGRDDLGSRPRRALQPARRAAGRGAVARARHLALVGRARRAAGLVAARPLHDAQADPAAERPAGVPRADARATSTPAMDSCSASRCCWRWSSPGSAATTPTGSCSATRCGRGTSRSTSGHCWRPTPTSSSVDLDDAFDLARSLATSRSDLRPAG